MGAPTPPQRPQPQPAARNARGRVVARTQQPLQASPQHFVGQLPGEQVVWIKRQSAWYLFATVWPVLLGLFILGVLLTWQGTGTGFVTILEIILGVVVVILAIRWLVTDLWNWFFNLYILTNQRVLTSKGYFNRRVGDIPLKSVAQVMVERPNALQVLLNIGDLLVRPIGTPLSMPGVAHPRDVADSILAVQDNPSLSTGQPAGPPIPQVRSQRLQDALEKLAQPTDAPVPPPVVQSPLGSFLHRKIPIRLIEGESVVEVIYRHWFVLLTHELLPLGATTLAVGAGVALTLFGAAPATGSISLSTVLIVGGLLLGGLWAFLVYLNWADDVFVLTTHRVVDVDRLLFLLSEYSNDAPYARIQDVHVERNAIGQALGFGSITVETSGRKYPVTMANIPHAFRVMDRIFLLIHQQKERENVALINKQKKENHRWMATVLDELLIEVPDVRGLAYLDALARTRARGLKLVVEAERLARGTPSGVVLDQVPGPGTTELPQNEVRIVLSGRGAPVAP